MSDQIAVQETCKEVQRLVDAHVVASFPEVRRAYGMTEAQWEQYAKELDQAVKDFQDFLRDHRSRDWVHLQVVRDIQSVCSLCGGRWETFSENGHRCACCGAKLSKEDDNVPA